MEKPVCYIPEQLINYYKSPNAEKDAFINKQNAIKTILSIYLEYQCLPTEINEFEPHDPNGLGIFEMICLKLLMMPKHTRQIRTVYSQIPEIYNRIIEKKQNITQVMDDMFSLEQLEDYGL
jgi:hypothetical protein